ncbi:MAG: TetR/AcrR family transcriptional regulator [Deinococcales bacterium]
MTSRSTQQNAKVDDTQIHNAKASTRERILDAALNIFSRKGYFETKMDEIVSEAKVSKGSIYVHFPNKEKLFVSLVDQFADLIERRVNEAIRGKKGIARVKLAIETVLAAFAQYRQPAKILLVQAVSLGNIFEKKRLEVHERFAKTIAEVLNEAIDLGDIALSIPLSPPMHGWGPSIQW